MVPPPVPMGLAGIPYGEARDTLILGALLSIPGALLLPVVWLLRRGDTTAPA